MPPNLDEAVSSLVREFSTEEVLESLKKISGGGDSQILTIVANANLHSVPAELLRGTIFNFSSGTVQLSESTARGTLNDLISVASRFLKSQRWKEIYLVPTGHPLLSIAAALLTYRITRISPVIVAYFGKEGYLDIDIDLRSFLAK